jgi:hypothetical protein
MLGGDLSLKAPSAEARNSAEGRACPLIRSLTKAGFTSWDVVLGRAFFSITFMGLRLIFRASILRRRSRRLIKVAESDDPGTARRGDASGVTYALSSDQVVPSPQDVPVFIPLVGRISA